MNKQDLVLSLSQNAGLSRQDSEIALNAIFQSISEELISGGKVQITGFGTFEAKQRAPRTGRDPKKNLPVKILARRVPYFTPSSVLRTAVERGGQYVQHRR